MSDPRSTAHRTRPASSPLDVALLLIAIQLGWQAWAAMPVSTVEPCAPIAEASAREGRTTAVLCGAGRGPAPEWMRGPARLLFDLPLDVNRADARTLESLPGIGPSRARAIVRARCERAFESVEALQRVPGIGPRTVERLQGLARAGPAVGGARSALACAQGSRFGADRPMSGAGPASVPEADGPTAPREPTRGAGSGEGAWRKRVDPQR